MTVGTVAGFVLFARITSRVGCSRVFARIAFGAGNVGRTFDFDTASAAVSQLTVRAGALRVFRAGNAFRVRCSGVFALFARAAIGIRKARNRGTAAFAVGNLSVVARNFTVDVVPRRARVAFAGGGVGLLTFGAGRFVFAITTAESVGDAVARAVAFFVLFAGTAGAAGFFIILSRGTRFRAAAVTAALAVGNLRPRTVAGITVFAGYALTVFANFSRAAGRIGANACRFVVFGNAFGRFRILARRMFADGNAFALVAQLTRQAVFVGRAHSFSARSRGCRLRRLPVTELDAFCNHERIRVVQHGRGVVRKRGSRRHTAKPQNKTYQLFHSVILG